MAYVVPSLPRMAYDTDGTRVFYYDPSIGSRSGTTMLSAGQIQALNSDDASGAIVLEGTPSWLLGTPTFICFVFPEPRDICGYFVSATADTVYGVHMGDLKVSTDTTDGFDGTWTTAAASMTISLGGLDEFRLVNTFATITGVRGVRIDKAESATAFSSGDDTVRAIHLYGEPSAYTEQLAFWSADLLTDVPLTFADLDFGDIQLGTTTVKTVRLKNVSATLTATTITVGMESLTAGSPSVLDQYSLSLDGVTYGSTVSIASLAPNTVSTDVIYVQRVIPVLSVLASAHTMRLTASAVSWAV